MTAPTHTAHPIRHTTQPTTPHRPTHHPPHPPSLHFTALSQEALTADQRSIAQQLCDREEGQAALEEVEVALRAKMAGAAGRRAQVGVVRVLCGWREGLGVLGGRGGVDDGAKD